MTEANASAVQQLHHVYFCLRQNHDANHYPPELELVYEQMVQGVLQECRLLGMPKEQTIYTAERNTLLNVENVDLNRMLAKVHATSKAFNIVMIALSDGDINYATAATWAGQRQNDLLRIMIEYARARETHTERFNAIEAFKAAVAQEIASVTPREECHSPDALALLASPATKRYTATIRECAKACRNMETERGLSPSEGMAEWFELQADAAELEMFGPKELR